LGSRNTTYLNTGYDLSIFVSLTVLGYLLATSRGGARHFHLGGPLEGPILQQGELSMVCVGLSERDLLQWRDVTRKILGGQNFVLVHEFARPHSFASCLDVKPGMPTCSTD